MKILYRKIDVPNLSLLQEKIMKICPEELFKNPRLFFPKNQNEFLNIPELVDLFDLYNLKINETVFGFGAMVHNSVLPIHVDWGRHDYSMNIPLINCDGTFTSFYKAEGEPKLRPAFSYAGVNYTPHYSYSNMKVNVIDKFESNIPCVMHIQTPHNVANPLSTIRINLLIRHNNNDAMANLLSDTQSDSNL